MTFMNTAAVMFNSYGFLGFSSRGIYFDWTFLLLIAGAVISIIASGVMRSYTSKYSKVRSSSGMTGSQAAQVILQRAGVTGVQIRPILGNLTDHYDPRTKVVNLAEESYDNTSLTGIGVAAHECGHAIQDAEGYGPLRLRSALVPVVNFGSSLSWPIFLIGLVFAFQPLLTVGIILFSAAVVFQLVTLPVEINASRRALSLLSESGLLQNDEIGGAKKVLTAAAMTYVAALLSTVLQLIRMVLLARGNSRDD